MTWEGRLIAALAGAAGGIGLAALLLYRGRVMTPDMPYDPVAVKVTSMTNLKASKR